MANIYVRSGAGGSASGADWTNACLTLAAGITASAAGDDIWVAADHAETTGAAVTLTFKGTGASPCRVFCAIHTGSVPPVSADLRTTASVTVTGAFNLFLQGRAYIRGIIFNNGNDASTGHIYYAVSNTTHIEHELCAFRLLNTSASSRIVLGEITNSPNQISWNNCTVQFGNTSQAIAVFRARFDWRNTTAAVTGATLPTTLFKTNSGSGASITRVVGVDLSAITGTIFGGGFEAASTALFQDCELNASATKSTSAGDQGGKEVFFNRCGSSAGSRNFQDKFNWAGADETETTIVRTGGASVNGTAVARKITTTSTARQYLPFAAIPFAIANSTTGANVTVTVHGIWGGGAVPTNADIWFEVGYLGSSGDPGAIFGTCSKADPLATATNHSADSSTWGGSTTDFTMAVTLSSPQPQLSGEMYVFVYAGANSTTFYIDPLPVIS